MASTKYHSIEDAAERLCMTPNALRIRCRRAQRKNRVTGRIEADIGDGVVAVKFGRAWRVRLPPSDEPEAVRSTEPGQSASIERLASSMQSLASAIDADREARFEQVVLLRAILDALRSKPRRVRQRGPNPPTRRVSPEIERLVDTRLARAGYYRP